MGVISLEFPPPAIIRARRIIVMNSAIWYASIFADVPSVSQCCDVLTLPCTSVATWPFNVAIAFILRHFPFFGRSHLEFGILREQPDPNTSMASLVDRITRREIGALYYMGFSLTVRINIIILDTRNSRDEHRLI